MLQGLPEPSPSPAIALSGQPWCFLLKLEEQQGSRHLAGFPVTSATPGTGIGPGLQLFRGRAGSALEGLCPYNDNSACPQTWTYVPWEGSITPGCPSGREAEARGTAGAVSYEPPGQLTVGSIPKPRACQGSSGPPQVQAGGLESLDP